MPTRTRARSGILHEARSPRAVCDACHRGSSTAFPVLTGASRLRRCAFAPLTACLSVGLSVCLSVFLSVFLLVPVSVLRLCLCLPVFLSLFPNPSFFISYLLPFSSPQLARHDRFSRATFSWSTPLAVFFTIIFFVFLSVGMISAGGLSPCFT